MVTRPHQTTADTLPAQPALSGPDRRTPGGATSDDLGVPQDGSWCAGRRWEVGRVAPAPPPLRRSGEPDPVGARLRRLLDATRAVTADLGLAGVLPQIVVSARDVVGSSGALLAILGDGGRPAQLVRVGVGGQVATSSESSCDAGSTGSTTSTGSTGSARTSCQRRACDVAPLDRGEGAPGLRLAAPPSIALPLRTRTRMLSNLYVTRPLGAEEFGVEDEELLAVFAATAAAAIDAALGSDQSSRSRQRHQASARITTALLSEADSPDVLQLVMTEGRRLVDADDVRITCPRGGSEEAVEAVAAGQERGPSWLTAAGTATTVLIATRHRGRPPFTAVEEAALADFAEPVAMALELARARAADERARVLEERSRIARDLHDHVIGRLFATGMAVQGLARWISDPAGRRQLAVNTDNLDAAIRDLRTLVYGLDLDPGDVWGLGARVRQVIDETSGHLGFTPSLTMDDDLDLPPGSATTDHLLAVLREALANVARHAGAHDVTISLTGGATIDLTVADDGCGLPDRRPAVTPAGGHGLANIAERADALGGRAAVLGNSRGGVTVRWSVPNTAT